MKNNKLIILALILPSMGMLSNILASTFLHAETFGRITYLNSLSLLISCMSSLGLSTYFMSNKHSFINNQRSIFILIISIGFIFSILSIIIHDINTVIAIISIVTITQLFLFYQIKYQNLGIQKCIILSQNVATIVKSTATFIVLILFYMEIDTSYSFILTIIATITAITTIIMSAQILKNNKESFLVFTKELLLDKPIYFFWGSYLLNFIPVFFMPIAAGLLGGDLFSAYFGIYLIFQSIALVLSQQIINRNYSALSEAYSKKDFFSINSLNLKITENSILLSFITFLFFTIPFYLGTNFLWNNYINIEYFLIFVIPCAIMKIIQTGYSMRISLSDTVTLKIFAQLIYLSILIISTYILFNLGVIGLAISLFISELTLTIIYYYLNKKTSLKTH